MKPASFPIALVLAAAPALAQTGTLDQESPSVGASFNLSAPSLVWQQQVRVGIAGQLEGFEVTLSGPVGGQVDLRLRLGDGWNTGPVVWSTTYGKTTSGIESPFLDVTAAGLVFAVGDTFVIESQGNDTGVNLRGSYVDPVSGPPLYPEELYLGGPGCYSNCGWRHGLRTWMVDADLGTAYCTATPNSSGGTASITAGGSSSVAANDLVLLAQPVPDQPGIFYYGPNQVLLPFGDGFRCVGGVVGRLPVEVGSGGVLTHALDNTSPPNGSTIITAGSTWNFQGWFRDPAAGGSGFNLSDGREITFQP